MSHYRSAGARGCAAIAVLVLLPTPVWACPVCYGALEGPIVDAVNLAIFALLGVTGTVLGGIATFFVYLARRARAIRQAEEWRVDPAVAEV